MFSFARRATAVLFVGVRLALGMPECTRRAGAGTLINEVASGAV